MKWLRSAFAGFALLLAGAFSASAQGPGPGPGPQPPPQLWIQSGNVIYWPNGCVIVGAFSSCTGNKLVTSAPTSSNAGFNLPHGTAPSAPNNGDLWTTTSGLFVRINGATVGPLTSASISSFAATAPLAVTFPGGIVTYALNVDASMQVSGGNLGINHANANTWTATQTFNPPTGTATSAILSTSTLPSSCASPPCATFNSVEIDVTNPGYVVTHTPLDAFGLLQSNAALRVNYTNAAATSNINGAIIGAVRATAPAANLEGIIGSTYENISASLDANWAIIGVSNVGPSGNIAISIALEAESLIATGGAAAYRIGVDAASQTSVTGTTLDAAYVISTSGTEVGSPYGGGTPWVNGIAFSKNLYGGLYAPFTGSAITADAAFTATNFAELPNLTLTGHVFSFPNFAMGQSGRVVFGAGAASIPAGSPQIATFTCSGCGTIQVNDVPDSTTGQSAIQISASGVNFFLGVGTASNTGTFLGASQADLALIEAYASASGLAIGTGTAVPLILGTNNTSWLNLSSAGLFAYTGQQQLTVAQTVASATALHWRNFYMAPATLTITGNTGSPITRLDAFALGQQTVTDSSAVTVTDAATLYIDNAPLAAGSVTITNAWALLIGTGNAKIGGNLTLTRAGTTLLTVTDSADSVTGIFQAQSGGLIIGTTTSTSVSFNVNSVQQAVLSGGGALSLGNSTAGVGNVIFNGGIGGSGSITLTAPSGALGTVTLTLPDGNDTLTSNNASQTLANKTLTSPLIAQVYGGSAAGSILTLTSTSNGSPSGDKVIIQSGGATRWTLLSNGNIGVGTETNPQYQYVVSANAATGLTFSITPIAAFNAADGSNGNFIVSAYGTGVNPAVIGYAARGTAASPTQTQSGDFLGFYAGVGRTNSSTWDNGPVGVAIQASEAHTSSAQGTQVVFLTVAAGGLVRATAAIIGAGLLVGPSGTDPGSGKIAVTSMANVATTSAVCYNTSSGLFTYDGTIGTCNTSDERLKVFERDRRLRDALKALVALSHDEHFGYFHASAQGFGQFGAEEHIGIGAQTAARFFPELTATGSDGMMSLAYDKLTVPIIEALAELKADNDNLRAEIERRASR